MERDGCVAKIWALPFQQTKTFNVSYIKDANVETETIEKKEVFEIDLGHKNISQLNITRPTLPLLKNLVLLHLQGNRFEYIPEEILELTFLQELNLGFNKLKRLSSKIYRLKELRSLYLNHNFISVEILVCSKLRSLWLEGNNLTRYSSFNESVVDLKDICMDNLWKSKMRTVELPLESNEKKTNFVKQISDDIECIPVVSFYHAEKPIGFCSICGGQVFQKAFRVIKFVEKFEKTFPVSFVPCSRECFNTLTQK
ncbi:hypothetical protein O9G_002674 [Rozella allomycis CSF55]|uniref:L domain-like protein n=1 Tax=Rozella allomycis (strain CSF55) TaxID=988480 RepID=A0A075B0I3_ROZAC|nr:hypothetical protein O9G_002674 [Rozella allomycis CSF55]|eukprot:EPZ36031.1 hypothetical protein O9G_002674 [Rozella allomycis CSF55]